MRLAAQAFREDMPVMLYTAYMNSDRLLHLKYSLQALAQTANVQINLFPDFVQVADELALDFNYWHLVVLQNNHELTDYQKDLLLALDDYLSEISKGVLKEELWTIDALQERSEWEKVRVFARKILEEFKWKLDLPLFDRNQYIQSRKQNSALDTSLPPS